MVTCAFSDGWQWTVSVAVAGIITPLWLLFCLWLGDKIENHIGGDGVVVGTAIAFLGMAGLSVVFAYLSY